jgi:hypothetical protein
MHGQVFEEIAAHAVRIESRTNLLFSFEKMALRDAVRTAHGQRVFPEALFSWLHGRTSMESRFSSWIDALDRLPRRQTRVVTWPLATVFGFIACPRETHLPQAQCHAESGAGLRFPLRVCVSTCVRGLPSKLDFARTVMQDMRALKPRDLIDAQSFIWVQGSDEYA